MWCDVMWAVLVMCRGRQRMDVWVFSVQETESFQVLCKSTLSIIAKVSLSCLLACLVTGIEWIDSLNFWWKYVQYDMMRIMHSIQTHGWIHSCGFVSLVDPNGFSHSKIVKCQRLYIFSRPRSREPKGWWPLGSGTFWNLPHTTQNTANMSMYVQYWQSQGFCTNPNRREGVCCVAIHSLIISQRQYSTKFKIQFGAPHRNST